MNAPRVIKNYVIRTLEEDIIKNLSKKEILAIIGPRQCGKTTMVHKILDELKGKKINRISFDDVKMLNLFERDTDNFIELQVN